MSVHFIGDPVIGVIEGLAIIALVSVPMALWKIVDVLRDIADILRRAK